MNNFENVSKTLTKLIDEWEQKLSALSPQVISEKYNSQNRNIRQIVGHMADSASNNTHRVIHLQYQDSPLNFPDYANNGNNDRWIAIQNYQAEDWPTLVGLWKYTNLHFLHTILQIDSQKLNHEWISALGNKITLGAMVNDFPRHFELHLAEIDALLQPE